MLLLFAEKRGDFVLAWKRDIAVLTAGNVKVTMNNRIRLMPPQGMDDSNDPQSSSYNLEIQNVRTTDAGDYACQLGTIVPKEIVHSLEVLGKSHMPCSVLRSATCRSQATCPHCSAFYYVV